MSVLPLYLLSLIACDPCPEGISPTADGTCPTGDCATDWADLDVGDDAVHVDASAESGGDGSAAKPYTTVQAALDAHASVVAIEPGTYRENLVVGAEVRLVGRCASGVILDGSTGADDAATIVAEGISAVELQNLTVTGAPHDGVELFDSSGELRDVVLTGNTFKNLVIDGASVVTLVDVEVSDGVPTEDGGGYGLGVTSGAVVTGTNVRITGNTGVALAVGWEGASLSLTDSEIRGTLTNEEVREPGFGVYVIDGASFSMEGGGLYDNGGNAVTLYEDGTEEAGPSVTLDGVVIDGLRAFDYGDGAVSTAIDAEGGTVLATNVSIRGALFGVYAGNDESKASVELVDVDIEATEDAYAALFAEGGADVSMTGGDITGPFRMALGAQDRRTTAALSGVSIHDLTDDLGGWHWGASGTDSAELTLDGVTIERVQGLAIDVSEDATVDGTGVQVRENLPFLADDGAGNTVEGGLGVVASSGGSLTLDGATLEDIVGNAVGVIDGGTALIKGDSMVTGVTGTTSALPGWAFAVATAGDEETSLTLRNVMVSDVGASALYAYGINTEIEIKGCDFSNIGNERISDDDLAAGLIAAGGAFVDIEDSTFKDISQTALLADASELFDGEDDETRATIQGDGLVISGILPNGTDPTAAVAAQSSAWIALSDSAISDAGQVGLYASGPALVGCDGCEISGATFADAVEQGVGGLLLEDTTLDAAGAQFGIWANGSGVVVAEAVDVADAVVADVYVYASDGIFDFQDVSLTDAVGFAVGDQIDGGNGIFVTGGIGAWEDETGEGLRLLDSKVRDNAGVGALFVGAGGTVCGVTGGDNLVDLVWQQCEESTGPEVCDTSLETDTCPAEDYLYESPSSFEFSYKQGDTSLRDGVTESG